MNPFAIAALEPVLAFDSRGTPTVSCEAVLAGGARAGVIVPSGASTGGHEAVELRDGGSDFAGRGVQRALASVRDEIAPAVLGLDVHDQELLDSRMCELDGTADLSRLGANAVLAVSLCAALAGAAQAGEQPYRWFVHQGAAGGAHPEPLLPLPMINIFSGGAHAAGGLDVQDLLAVPVGAATLPEALHWVWELRHALAEELGARGFDAQMVADEGGFGVPLRRTADGLELMVRGMGRAGLRPGIDMAIAIDVAANQLLDGDEYLLAGDQRRLTSAQLVAELRSWCDDFPVVSVEDPVAEDDWDGLAAATCALPDRQVLGDDIFVTDTDRLRRAIDARLASAVLVKPNQCGTLTGARRVVDLARRAGYATVLSARSGDTEDAWLADLAVGWRTGQIKVGSLTRSERTAKWNRLLRIADQLGPGAAFAGRRAIVARSALVAPGDDAPGGGVHDV